MNKRRFVVVSLALSMLFVTGAAYARNSKFALKSRTGSCMSPGADGSVILWDCVNNSNQVWTWNGYGQIVHMDQQKCLTVREGKKPVVLADCVNSAAQRWALDDSTGRLNNEQGWCIDAEGARSSNGTRLLAYGCHSGWNQKFTEIVDLEGLISKTGMSRKQAAYLRNTSVFVRGDVHYNRTYRILRVGGGLVGPDGASLVVRGNDIVAAGAGNIVAAGAGNIVAAGAGNIVAAGAGNFVFRP